DLKLLVRHFLKKHGSGMQIADDAMEVLSRYEWPGNVRELENAIEHAIAVCSNHIVRIPDLPDSIVGAAGPGSVFQESTGSYSLIDDRPNLDELSRRYVHLILSESDGNKSRAAQVLGINRRTLYRYLDSNGTAPSENEASASESAHEPLEN